MSKNTKEKQAKKVKLLSWDFLNKYPDFPAEMNSLGKFVYLRTYSRFLPKLGRRETYKETVIRATEYNVNLAIDHLVKYGIPFEMDDMVAEAELLFENMYRLRQFLSGRTMWVGGAEGDVAEKFPLANFNCSFTNIEDWEDLAQMFYLLLVGTGVGFKSTKAMAKGMSPIRTDIVLANEPYNPLPKHMRRDDTVAYVVSEDTVRITVGDSKEGWVDALRQFFRVLTGQFSVWDITDTVPDTFSPRDIKVVRINYDHIRMKGERLMTFGGTASGPEPLMEMFEGFMKVFRNLIDPSLAPLELAHTDTTTDKTISYYHVRPIHILDCGNLIGNNVVVGGVRRTAEIFLFDADDFECLFAKYGINGYWKEEDFKKHEEFVAYLNEEGITYPSWFDALGVHSYDENTNKDFITGQPRREADGSLSPFNFGTGFHHRSMSNNSVAFTEKPSRSLLHLIFLLMQKEGEPGFINLEEAARRRLKAQGIPNPSRELLERTMVQIGLNPCAEIILRSKGVCNLTTVVAMNFVHRVHNPHTNTEYRLDIQGLLEAQRLSARCGLRMTLVRLELPKWDEVQQIDRLIGTSLTGWYDAVGYLHMSPEDEANLLHQLAEVVRDEVKKYAKFLRVSEPLLDTTMKPEGTLTQVAGGHSPGMHRSHAPDYIRRVRINSEDPLAKTIKKQGWKVSAENGTPGATPEERLANARTLVTMFALKSGAKVTKDEVSVTEQFSTYFMFQENYTRHNSSNTITVKPHEWEVAEQIVWDNWGSFTAVSFLAHDGGTYQQAPYEAISEELCEKLRSEETPVDMDILQEFEVQTSDSEDRDRGQSSCENGVCPL